MSSISSTKGSGGAAVASATRRGRIWAWAGVAAFVLGIVVTWSVQFVYSPDDLESGGQVLFDALNSSDNETLFRVTSGLGFATVAALVAFGAGLRQFLAERDEGNLPWVVFGSILVTAAALGMAMSFRAQVFDGIDYYTDSTTSHITINRLQQDSVLAGWAAMLAATAATAVGGIRGTMVPRALGWFSGGISILILLMCLVGLAFPSNIPALLWLGVMSAWSVRSSGKPGDAGQHGALTI